MLEFESQALETAGKLIAEEFKKAGLKLKKAELQKLSKLHLLLLSRNQELDLTRITDPRTMAVKHYLDSALAAGLMEHEGTLMDLGSGAGFPGLPMAILKPHWRLLLAEPRAKRLKFLDEAIALLKLDNVALYPHKVTGGLNMELGGLVARDFGSCESIIGLAAEILPKGARLHLMKGPAAEIELKRADNLPERREFGKAACLGYSLGPGWPARRLISMVKLGRSGRPEKRPGRGATEIASPMNPRYKSFVKLLDGRGAKKAGEAILSGRKSVPETLKNHPEKVLALLAAGERGYEGLDIPGEIEIIHLRSEIFPALDLFGTGPPLLLIKAEAPPEWNPAEPFEGIRLLVPFQDPANVGAVIRTAAAMGVEVVLLKEAANPFHPKALRASGPAVFEASLLAGPSLEEIAPGQGFYALTPKGHSIRDFKPPSSLHLVMGLEGQGLKGAWPEKRRLAIPMKPGVESLNAAAAAAVAMALMTGPQ
ncbi:MAG: 16S rRNA (guanine(527)-N(7))-methyltransferase RsmG [Deltaproteobacteria bacterium]|jgi:16S rRNA (guanine527-N7)-methyltransferase|nr:16S rRNA (guanine(527)-N(7))-methyltransferase RsmG [Deltaproteobacteria bacterium]